MNNPTLDISIIFGVVFGFLGSLIAYLITYKEWVHHYPTKKEPKRIALQTAIFAFIFFLLVSILLGLFYKP